MNEALKKYGRHLKSCELFRHPFSGSTDYTPSCDCGFSKALGCGLCDEKGYVVNLDLSKHQRDSGFLTGNCPECGAI